MSLLIIYRRKWARSRWNSTNLIAEQTVSKPSLTRASCSCSRPVISYSKLANNSKQCKSIKCHLFKTILSCRRKSRTFWRSSSLPRVKPEIAAPKSVSLPKTSARPMTASASKRRQQTMSKSRLRLARRTSWRKRPTSGKLFRKHSLTWKISTKFRRVITLRRKNSHKRSLSLKINLLMLKVRLILPRSNLKRTLKIWIRLRRRGWTRLIRCPSWSKRSRRYASLRRSSPRSLWRSRGSFAQRKSRTKSLPR